MSGAVDRAELLAEARARLDRALDGLLGDRLRATGPAPRGRPGWVVVGDVDVAGRCPARFAHPEASTWSDLTTITATRTLGRFVLRRWDGRSTPAGTLDALLEHADDLPDWLANGLEPLDRSALAAVRSSTLAWVGDALLAVRSQADLVWDGGSQRVDLPGRTIQLAARWDARLGSRAAPTTLLVHSPRAADADLDRVVAGFTALVVCHRSTAVPERVRFCTSGTGVTRAVTITRDVLAAGVDRVVELVGTTIRTDEAPTVPGGWCRWCHRLEVCDAGRGHLRPAGPAAPA